MAVAGLQLLVQGFNSLELGQAPVMSGGRPRPRSSAVKGGLWHRLCVPPSQRVWLAGTHATGQRCLATTGSVACDSRLGLMAGRFKDPSWTLSRPAAAMVDNMPRQP